MRVKKQWGLRKGRHTFLRMDTLNIGAMTEKGRVLADMMERRNVDILCLQETKWKRIKAKSIGFKLFYNEPDGKEMG